MPNIGNYKESDWYKNKIEETRSDANTRKLRIAGYRKFLDGDSNYILTPIRKQLRGHKFVMLVDGKKRNCVITNVYPHCVLARYRVKSALSNEKHVFRIGMSIPDLMEKHIIDCSGGYCRYIEKEEKVNE